MYGHSASRYWESDPKIPEEDRKLCKDIARQLVENDPGRNINVRKLHFRNLNFSEANRGVVLAAISGEYVVIKIKDIQGRAFASSSLHANSTVPHQNQTLVRNIDENWSGALESLDFKLLWITNLSIWAAGQ
ncbi:hypothetical protein AVEN_204223-1 [Araneus ventricosus]|uniref:Uncharacterized protein n=1 Tax=Araneus ventricosus TaxID=182803 RepID=A0A4Y2I709_ARAVE|nr:hypothetical protein AVEN_204223-1 [Araneus ventricosus]